MMKSAEHRLLEKIEALRSELSRPVVVALDGGSGSGKSTIVEKLAKLTDIALVPLDDFYQTQVPESEWPKKSVMERLNGVFEWDRVRHEAIEPLLLSQPAQWRAFDFMQGLGKNGTYSLKDEFTKVPPAPTILLEGAYSASPFLRDLVDLAVIVDVPTKVRHQRLAVREQDEDVFLAKWHAVWDDVENHYFEHVSPPKTFDLVIQKLNSDLPCRKWHNAYDKTCGDEPPRCIYRRLSILSD